MILRLVFAAELVRTAYLHCIVSLFYMQGAGYNTQAGCSSYYSFTTVTYNPWCAKLQITLNMLSHCICVLNLSQVATLEVRTKNRHHGTAQARQAHTG